MKSYTEMMTIPTFEGRILYLQTNSQPSEETFGYLRPINQAFYNSRWWKEARKRIIARDGGWDLAFPGRSISGRVLVHHINPILPKDLYEFSEWSIDPENLVTVSHPTHQFIHYRSGTPTEELVERRPGDTVLWRGTND